MSGLATVYRRGTTCFIQTSSRTTAGLWRADGPCEVLSADDEGGLGESTLRALGRSREGLRQPLRSEYKGFGDFEYTLKAAGTPTWAAFVKGAHSVTVQKADGSLRLTPMRNMGAKDGFAPMTDRSLSMPAESEPSQVGATLLRLLTLDDAA
jgi:hypothetical protein